MLEYGVAEERGDGVEDAHVHPVAHQQENVAGVRHQVPGQKTCDWLLSQGS